MKKIIFLLSIFLGLTLTSCSSFNEPKFAPAVMETVYSLPLTTTQSERDYAAKKAHFAVYGDNLYNIAKRYLGDGNRWGDLLVENDYLASEASRRVFHRPNGITDWRLYPGEIVLLPNDAIGITQFFEPMSREVVFDLGTQKLEDFKRQVPVERDPNKIFIRTSTPALAGASGGLTASDSNISVMIMPTIVKDLFWILAALVLIFLAAALIYYLLNWMRGMNHAPNPQRIATNQTSETESRTNENLSITSSFNETHHHHHYHGDGCSRNASAKMSKQLKKIVKEARASNMNVFYEDDNCSFELDSRERTTP